MPEILVQNLDDAVVEQLESRARKQRPIVAGGAEANPGGGDPKGVSAFSLERRIALWRTRSAPP